MPTRLLLLAAGATAATRNGRFARGDEPLDAGGAAKVGALDWPYPPADRVVASPDAAAQQTAALLGLAAGTEPALRDQCHGDWTGRGLDALDPGAVSAWLATPEGGTPGGEALAAVRGRVAPWLDALPDGWTLAITHPAVLRVAVAHAMAVDVAATMAIDVAPLSCVILSRHDRWRVQEVRAPGYRRSR